SLLGYIAGIVFILLNWFFVVLLIDGVFPVIGPIINIFLIPAMFFTGYCLNVFISLGVIYPMMKKLQKGLPDIDSPKDDGTAEKNSGKQGDSIEITDAQIIEKWKCCKWLKWRMVDRVLRSLFPDVSTVLYKFIGKDNHVALKSMFTEAVVDTDHVSIGENTLLSVGTHVYAYKLTEDPNPRLVIKKTSIGRNCVIAPSNIMAGANIGDNVMLGIHSVVPEDMHLESNQMYAGNPAVDIKTFISMKKQAKQKLGIDT
ncbi:MAG: hypothetical protein Q6373_005510, partial [Candidatus Sigynarchaeota archaeon]